MHFRLLTAALTATLAAAPALGQDIPLTPKQSEQLACISDWLDDAGMALPMADVYARGETEGNAFEETADAMEVAMIECQGKYKWTDEQTNLAAEVGMFTVVFNAISVRFAKAGGVTDATFGKLADVLNAMPPADRQALDDGSWRDNADLQKRIKDALVSAGVPRQETVLEDAMLILEARLIVTYGTMAWVKQYPS